MSTKESHVDDPTVAFEEVTPDVAAALLERNGYYGKNRLVRDKRVVQWAAEMKAGRYMLTHQGIAIDWHGNLIDGQHRLLAVIEAGVPVRMLVARGVDPETYKVIDTGTKRTAGDILGQAGVVQSNVTAATLRLLAVYDLGVDRPWGEWRKQYSAQDLLDEVANYPGLGDSIRHAAPIIKRIGGTVTGWAAGLYLVDRWARQCGSGVPMLAAGWREGLVTGANMDAGDPRLALGSWITNSWKSTPGAHRAELLMMLTLRAFHASVLGQDMKRMLVKNPSTFVYRLPTGPWTAARNTG